MEVTELVDQKNWKVRWMVRKWKEADHLAGLAPYEVVRFDDNILLNDGITVMQQLIGGIGGTSFSNANARLKVGNSNTAAVASQTDLQGGSTAEHAMDSTYPQVSGQTQTWRSTFGTAEANFTWQEYGVKNGAGAISGSVKLLNRKVQLLGTKPNTEVWELTLTITMS